MSKKNLFVSAALTAFVLVILVNVASAYKQISSSSADVQPALPTVTVTSTVEVLPTETSVVVLTHQEAALVAANFLGDTDLFSVENAPWEEKDAYKVVFSSGYIVYVSLDGQILSSEAPQPVFVSVPAPATNNGGSGQSQTSSNNSQQQDHDEDDDDDHDDEDEDHEENDDD